MDFNRQWFFDGAMGSMLQNYGMKTGEPSDMQNLINGSAVLWVHRQYIEAGVDILTANTFGAYSFNYDNFDEIIIAAVNHMKEAIGGGSQRQILMAHDMGPTGKVLEPYGDLSSDECYNAFLQSAQTGLKAGVDLILVETMMDINELKSAVKAAKTTGLPVLASMTFDKNGRTIMGTDLPTMVAEMEMLEVSAIGMNCGYGPDLYTELIPQLAELTNLPILVQPNAGLPEIIDGELKYLTTPSKFAKEMAKMTDANILGGCCGTTPEHIKEMIDLCRR